MNRQMGYLQHIIYHGEIIHERSSHIIIRTSSSYKNSNLYVTSYIPWINDSDKYYCPCNVDSKMKMEKLIEHIRTIHMGISPYYVYDSNN